MSAKPDRQGGSWVRRFHPAPDRPIRLVQLPHAGGAASFYFPFSAALSAVADVLSIQYPGRQDRLGETCLDNVADLADGVFGALRPWLDRPIVLFGHSMGATVAFEVARRLERDLDLVPHGLVVSGRRAPADVREEGLHRLPDAALIAEMAELSGTDPRLLEDPELVRMILPAVRADYRAAETYVYRPGPPLRCPVLTLVSDADPRVTVDEAHRWKDYTTGRFDLKVFPGDHFYLTDHRPAVIDAITGMAQAGP